MRLGLRVTMGLLFGVGMVPGTALLLVEIRQNLAHVRESASEQVTGVARLVAEQHQRAVDTAQGMLLAISRLPSVRAADASGCTAAVSAIAGATDQWANLGAVYPDGRMFCSAYPMPGPIDLADRPFIQNALRTGGIGSGTLVVSRVRGIGAFGFGNPVRDDRGAVTAVTFASLRTDRLQRQLDGLPLPEGVAIQVVDRAGAVVSGRVARGPVAGDAFGREIAALAMAGEPLRETAGADGIRRVFGFAPIVAADGPAMWAIAAVPTEAIEAPVRALGRRTLGSWAIAMLAVALGTGFVVEVLLIRRFRAISGAASRIAAGDHHARTGLRRGRDELGDLVGVFDDMAGSLEELQRQRRLLLDSIGDGILGLDAQACVVFANPAAERLLGVPLAAMKGRPFADLFRHAGPRGDPCLVRQSLQDGQVHLAADDTFTRLDGASLPVESVTTPMMEDRRIVGAVVALRDVSERRRLEDQLRQAQKMEAVGQLAGGVAHDFNNLLTAIITCARMVQEALAPNHPAQPDVEEILSSGDRAAQLTRQLLAFARRQRHAPRPTDLRELVAGIERMLRRVLGETITLTVDLPGAPVVVHADPGQLELVVLNLAVNARDAMASGGELRIGVGEVEATERAAAGVVPPPSGRVAQLAVRDTGVGMDEDVQDRIFEPFFTTKPSGQGTGLGLATVYGIVKQSGGVIHVRSERGKGTEFRVLLPLHAGAPAATAPTPERPPGGSEHVLVLEDDDVLRSLVCRALAGAGYRVAEASRPSAALGREEDEIDLLVTDLVLPERSGWDLYREMVARRPALRVLIMSGFAAEPSPEVASALPSDVPFLPKPFAPHDLLAKVRQALDGPPPAI